MIVKVVKAGRAGTERALGTYVLDLKHEHKGERLGEYALDLKHGQEKVEWARTVNTGVDDPRWAIQAIEKHNAQNTRKHSVSRYEHVIVSFTQGERPTREQMAQIEDRLCRSIGFGDHPRLSAVHKPGYQQRTGNNWHLHIAVSRIDPVTLKAEHPRYNHFSLQAEAARLERDLDLSRERKTLLHRERQEIDRRDERERAALDRTIKEREMSETRGRSLYQDQEARKLSRDYDELAKLDTQLTDRLASHTREASSLDFERRGLESDLEKRRQGHDQPSHAGTWLGRVFQDAARGLAADIRNALHDNGIVSDRKQVQIGERLNDIADRQSELSQARPGLERDRNEVHLARESAFEALRERVDQNMAQRQREVSERFQARERSREHEHGMEM